MTQYDFVLSSKNCFLRSQEIKKEIEACDDFFQKAFLMDEYNYMVAYVLKHEKQVDEILKEATKVCENGKESVLNTLRDFLSGYVNIDSLTMERDEADIEDLHFKYHAVVNYLKSKEVE